MNRKNLMVFLALLFASAHCGDSKTDPGSGLNDGAVSGPEDAAVSDDAAVPVPDDVASYGGSLSFRYVSVPETHAAPSGKQIKLAVTVLQSTSTSAPDVPVLIVSGGPGNDATTFFNNAALTRPFIDSLRSYRHIILLDQRGTGYSDPAFFSQSGEATQAFHDRLVAEGNDLSAFNTDESAADVKDVLDALETPKVDVYSVSYGTFLAQDLMRTMPERIRAVVLDSTLPTTTAVSRARDSGKTFQDGLVAFLQDCSTDPACAAAFPNLVDDFFALADTLTANPASFMASDGSGGESQVSLDGVSLLGMFETLLVMPSFYPHLPLMIEELKAGKFDHAVQTVYGARPASNPKSNATGLFNSVFCRDFASYNTKDEVLAADAELRPQIKAYADALAGQIFDTCAVWAVGKAPEALRQTVTSSLPTLILAGAFDTKTSPSWGQLVGETLPSSFYIELPRTGHGASGRPCGQSMIQAFFADPSTEPDSSCIESLKAAGLYETQ